MQRIPFIFASGYGADVVFGGRFAATPVVRKPYQSEHASRAIDLALGMRRERVGWSSLHRWRTGVRVPVHPDRVDGA